MVKVSDHEVKSFRKTLNFFPVNFSMRANLVQQEPKWLAWWQQLKIGQNEIGNPSWQLHDGPIFANGVVHLGHGLNRILKDIWVRYHYGLGRPASVVIGWDTHGWPVENAIYQQYPDQSWATQPHLLRQVANRYVERQIETQKSVFQRLGLFTNWNHHYQTNHWDYEQVELKIWHQLLAKNYLYRALNPVLWSCNSQQVIPDAGVEYRSVVTPHAFILFLVDQPNSYRLPARTSVVIWTTTLWTLPGNQMVAINPQLSYVLIQADQRHLIIAQQLLATMIKQCNWKVVRRLRIIPTEVLIKFKLHPPFGSVLVSIQPSDHVSSDQGSGCVHIAGAFGPEDYQLVTKHQLELKLILNRDGCFNDQTPLSKLIGVKYDQSIAIIIDYLKTYDRLLFLGQTKHSAPFSIRTHQPLIYFASWQWFLNLRSVKKRLPQLIRRSQWIPGWARDHILKMIVGRDDWCLSRQRSWGVPLIEFFDQHGHVQADPQLVQFAIDQLTTHQSCDSWWTNPCDNFLPPQFRNQGWTKGTNTLDVWFDSGCSFLAARLRHRSGPVQFAAIAEGKDQFRGWFNATLILSCLIQDQVPFSQALVHGFVVDQTGAKLSKSQGTALTLAQFIDQHGVDIWRLIVANAELTVDLVYNTNHLTEIKTQYRKIRNTFRFMIANLVDFKPDVHRQTKLTVVDRFVLAELNQLYQTSKTLFNQWQFSPIIQSIMTFITVKLSGFYFEAAKQSLYTAPTGSRRRRQIQTTLFNLSHGLLAIFKPVLVFTSEEIYHHLPVISNQPQSIHQVRHRTWIQTRMTKLLRQDWDQVLKLKHDLNLAFSQVQTMIVDQLQAKVTFCWKNPPSQPISVRLLTSVLRVGRVKIIPQPARLQEYNSSWIKIELLSDYQRCHRCWRFWPRITRIGICRWCQRVLNAKTKNDINLPTNQQKDFLRS